jgi:hypothetical protein
MRDGRLFLFGRSTGKQDEDGQDYLTAIQFSREKVRLMPRRAVK